MMNRLSKPLLMGLNLLLAGLSPWPAAADEGVYGPAAPANSAFLRVFNATPRASLEGRIADKVIADIPDFGASEFIFLPAGTHTLTIGSGSQTVKLDKGRYYTAALTAEGVQLLENQRFNNRLKSLVILYNLSDAQALNLRTADGRPVVEKVARNSSGSREVNAVKVELQLYDGDSKLAAVKPIALERGKAFSLFVTGSKASPAMVWAIN